MNRHIHERFFWGGGKVTNMHSVYILNSAKSSYSHLCTNGTQLCTGVFNDKGMYKYTNIAGYRL